jgi:hypothetical protein
MKNTRLAFTFAAALLVSASAGAQSTAAQLRAIDSTWAHTYFTHDTATFLKIVAPEVVITATNGSTKDRAKELEDVKPYPGMTVNYFRSANVTVIERAGVVIGTLEWETSSNGRTSPIRRRYTATYAKGGPLGWQMVALHIGQAPPQP